MSFTKVEINLAFSSDEVLSQGDIDFLATAIETQGVQHLKNEGLMTQDDSEAIITLEGITAKEMVEVAHSPSLLEHLKDSTTQAVNYAGCFGASELNTSHYDSSLSELPALVSELTDEENVLKAIEVLKLNGMTDYAEKLGSVIEHSLRHAVYQDHQ